MQHGAEPWWSTRRAALLLVVAAALPLLWPSIPPFVDLLGHMGRYRVQLEHDTASGLARFYEFRWALIGNLGVDLLIVPMSRLFGLEFATKLIVIAVPLLTMTGLLWVAREAHGTIPPTVLLALPLAYNHPLIFGFINFALSMALGLCAFALWLRMARLNAVALRNVAFVPISIILWVCHAYGWGTLGLLAFAAETVRQREAGRSWAAALVDAVKACLALAAPLLLMIAWRSGEVGGGTGDWFNWSAKLQWLAMTLRDRWRLFDTISIVFLAMVIVFAIRDPRLGFSRPLAAGALLLALVFALMPRIVFGSNYADMRLTPFMFAIALIAIRPLPRTTARFAQLLALTGVAFLALRTAASTVSYAQLSAGYDRALGALDHVPAGARVVAFVGHDCTMAWSTNRMEHLPAMAIVRRGAFSNDQWQLPGAQLLTVRYPSAGAFASDPSQLVTDGECPGSEWRSIDWSLANLPRRAFDYIWLIDPPAYAARGLAGTTLLWRDGTHALYRIDRRP